MIIKQKIDHEKMLSEHNHFAEDIIKFCIDRKRRVVAIDREMHIGAGRELTDEYLIQELTDILNEWIDQGE